MVCIRFARDGVGANFHAPCHALGRKESVVLNGGAGRHWASDWRNTGEGL
jgi:hypothetical protein